MDRLKKIIGYSVTVTTIMWSVGLFAMPLSVFAASSGDLIKKAGSSSVYYLGSDNKRYVFPSGDVYFSWYSDFSGVQTLSNAEVDGFPLGGNVTVRPGTKLVQAVTNDTPWVVSDPKVYAVSGNGTLRHITSASLAESLFGANWESMIVPVVETVFVGYNTGGAVNTSADYNSTDEQNNATTINEDKNLGSGTSGSGTGTSLTLALAPDTPAATLAPNNAARLPFTKINATASCDGDIVIDSAKVKLVGAIGSSSKDAYTGVDLVDGRSMLPFDTNSKTFNADDLANFTRDITIPSCTTVPIYITGTFGTNTNYAGEVHALQLDSMVLKNGSVVGSLPIVGNGHTINSTITIASATVQRGAFSNASDSALEVGKTDYTFFSFRIQAGSAEDVKFNNIRVYQVGSASFTDMDNLKLYRDGTFLVDGQVDPQDSKYMNFSLASGITVNKGQTVQFQVKGDIVDGSGRTVQLAVNNDTDLLVQGVDTGYNAVPTYSGTGSSASKPFLTDNQFTIAAGTLVVSKSNEVQATNIAIGDSQELGAFKFKVEGEPIEVTALTLTVASVDATNITVTDATRGYRLVDPSGVTVAGPTDLTQHALTVKWTDTFTVPVGETVYKVVADIASNSGFSSNDTITVSFNPGSNVTARGESTGDTVTPTPSASISGNTQTFKVVTLEVTRDSIPASQTLITGADQALFGSWTLDATDSGEDVRVTTIGIAASATNVNNLTLYVEGVPQTPINTDPASAGSRNTSTFGLGEPIVIPKGTKKQVQLKADISTAGSAGEVSQFGITSASGITGTGLTTGNTLTATVTADDGATITYAAAGTLTVANTNTPEQSIILSATDVTINSLKLSATNEDIVLDDLTVHIADGGLTGTGAGNYQDVSNVAIYNGSNKLVESNIGATNKFKFNFSQNPSNTNYVKVPKDGSVTLTVKISTAEITTTGTNNPGTPNADFKIGFGGTNSFKATGVDSGSNATETYTSSTSTAKILHASKPTVTLPSTSNRLGAASQLSNGDIRIYAFEVTADSSQGRPVMMYRFSFKVATSSVNVNTPLYLKQDGVSSKVSEADKTALDQYYEGDGAGRVAFLFDSPDFSEGDKGEQLEVASGQTKRFYLHGTVANASAGDTVTINLLGDNASTMTDYLTGSPADVHGANDEGRFVWSDDHTNQTGSTNATAASVWFNGYLVDGLEQTVTTTGYTISL